MLEKKEVSDINYAPIPVEVSCTCMCTCSPASIETTVTDSNPTTTGEFAIVICAYY